MLVAHHQRFGYRDFVIDHFCTRASLAELRTRLGAIDGDIRCFRLTLPLEENLRRIDVRASARAIDENAFEQHTVRDERATLAAHSSELGEPFDVSAPPPALVAAMLKRLAPF